MVKSLFIEDMKTFMQV